MSYTKYRNDVNQTLKRQAKNNNNDYQIEKDDAILMENTLFNKNRLVNSILPMVENIARGYSAKCLDRITFEDLISAGNMGAVIAADRWLNTPILDRIDKDSKFSTMAYHWVIKYIKEEITSNKTILSHGTTKSNEAAENWVVCGDAKSNFPSGSMDNNQKRIFDEYDRKHQINFEDTSDERERIEKISINLFKSLTPLEKRVIFAHWGVDCDKPKRMEVIGKMMGRNKSWAFNVIENAKKKIKKQSENISKDDLEYLQRSNLQFADSWKISF